MKIYTKTGDRGTTSLMGGKRVDKSDLRIKAYGEVDELNSLIGLILADLADYSSSGAQRSREVTANATRHPELDSGSEESSRQARTIKEKLLRTQNELLVLGSDLATPLDIKIKIPRISKSFITRLEKEIDRWTASLPSLRNFILPGGGQVGSKLHLARTIARRAERSIATLSQFDKINQYAQIYINRLSDWFFTLARYVNKLEGHTEKIWKGRSKT